MPWCCGLANSGEAASTALITTNSNADLEQQQLDAANTSASKTSTTFDINFGPMLVQPKKTLSAFSKSVGWYITALIIFLLIDNCTTKYHRHSLLIAQNF
ncbi:unnamed protein product [Thelazia callipaeda]|uniref:Uncharacterized protein n=1 Tax=Thelazia callipaeda TaxID=103827 RepID=A0A0N5D4C2_THECL|nr:unnamed protein product [Thelazia callipaeda]